MRPSGPELAQADFFWALRILQAQHPAGARIGESTRLREDWLRLRQAPHFSHLTGSIERFTPGVAGTPDEVRVRFLGLFGPNGALPLHVTELAAERALHHRDETLWRFLDLFHHRVLTLFFRAWAVHQPTVDLDRPEQAVFPGYVGALLGVGDSALCRRGTWDDFARLYFAGHLSRPARNSEGLERMIEEFFQVPAQVLPFRGKWIDLPVENRCELGRSAATGALGQNAYVGEQVWDCQTSFRLRIGPVRLTDFLQFIPGTVTSRHLLELVRFYVGLELGWDVQCVLQSGDVPMAVLGGSTQLGWTSWLSTRPPAHDADDLVINLDSPLAA